jgi:hypothetical protein
VPEHDLVDIAGRHAGIRKRLFRHAHDQAFDRLAFQATEGRVSQADDATSHERLRLFHGTERFQADRRESATPIGPPA